MTVGTWEWWEPKQEIESHAVIRSECRYMVVGIVPFVQKGQTFRELNLHREMQGMSKGTWEWRDHTGNQKTCSEMQAI